MLSHSEDRSARLTKGLRTVFLICALLGFAGSALATETHPLKPIPTGDPRETLQGFLAASDELYRLRESSFKSYAESGRLYMNAQERAQEAAMWDILPRATGVLDISGISPVLRDTVPIERAIMLREILDRIDIPAAADIPDHAEMARLGLKKWRLPDTEIDFVLIEQGPRAGQYLVSADTVNRLPEFYEKVKNLPDRSEVTRALVGTVAKLNPDQAGTVYDAYLSSPAGLTYIVPTRWLMGMPAWADARVLGLAPWQWLGVSLGWAIGALLIFAAYRAKRRLKKLRRDDQAPRYHALIIPLAVIFVAGALLPTLSTLFRIGGAPRVLQEFAQTAVMYLAAAWLFMVAVVLFVEVIIASERVDTSSLDGQLARLAARLVGLIGAVAILIRGADAMGMPAYSVVAGLGVGGLAVALAARDSVANLFGSILIMFEKPFRVGHLIRLAGHTGTVEDVGFRSTRLRTLDNALISIPNNSVVNTNVENLSARPQRRQKFLVQVTYDTAREKLDALLEGIRKIIVEYPCADCTNFHVRFNDFGESSLDILVIVHIMTDDYGQELQHREAILLKIMDLVQDMDLEFAFPTRTLHVETLPAAHGPECGRARETSA